jgi:hypothetical protein
MRVPTALNQLVKSAEASVHKARVEAVLACTAAVIAAKTLVPARVGQAVAKKRRIHGKHGIKMVDRLLANGHLPDELVAFFSAAACKLLKGVRRPVLLVDWTDVTGEFRALYASVAFKGRSLILYEEVHPECLLGNTWVQQRFLQRLQQLLPPDCQATIVTDAGFHGDFFREVRRLGWHYIGRIRGTATMRVKGRRTTKRRLYRRATPTVQDFGLCQLYANHPLDSRLVLIRKPRKPGRHSPPTRNKEEREYRKRAKDPWLLATSMTQVGAGFVVSLFSKRMQVEESFRDAKSPRFGFSLRHVHSKEAERLAVLLLLATLATLVLTLIGLGAEQQGLHRHFQANTTHRRVLSLVTLGLLCLEYGGLPPAVPLTALPRLIDKVRRVRGPL